MLFDIDFTRVASAVTQLKGGEENLASQPGQDTTSIYPGAPSTTTHNQLFLYAQSRGKC
jgi:hypothetical protein